MGATMTQMNTRIDATLKTRGDEALARAGYTPSQAIRTLWEFAAAHALEPGEIRRILPTACPSPEASEKRRKLREKVAAGPRIIERFCRERETTLADSPIATMRYKELRDLMYEEKLKEMGAQC